jgi:16S rRNA (uracil1498-N3)-methyltransferase
MQRYFVNKKDNNKFIIDYNDFHHIKNVMRMNDNDNIEVVYNGKVYLCKININEKNIEANIIKEIESSQDNINITIAQGLPKSDKLDYIIQKTTELGVSSIIPLKTERSIVKYDDKKENKKIERWQKIAKEASEQAKRITIPKIENIKNIQEILDLDYDVKLLCTVNEKSMNIKHCLQNINKNDKIIIVVGPEGGFTNEEETLLINSGFMPINLGRNILRTETAPLFIMSAIKYELME